MILDQLNLNQLRVFESVYRNRSMTAAARELHLTQSGVSQHIKSFEGMLGVKLFDRMKQRLVPTGDSHDLYRVCAETLQSTERVLNRLRSGGELSGTVSIGMPIEFGNNVILPRLAEFSRKHPKVEFRFNQGFASSMNQPLLNGDLDFAFVDDFAMDRRISVEKVYEETLELCISRDWLKKLDENTFDRVFFEQLEYVEYQEGEHLLRAWFRHHLKLRQIHLNVRATIMDVQGIAKLILNGMGAGIIPDHLIERLGRDGRKLHKFQGCGRPLKNSISIACLSERSSSAETVAVMKFLKESFGFTTR